MYKHTTPPADLIREFYSNLSVHEDLRGHTVASCIRGVPFRITRECVSKALDIPIIRTPTYPYSRSPRRSEERRVGKEC